MDKDVENLKKEALEAGFSLASELNVKALNFMPEVRDMCVENRCGKYGKNWMCPPACGTLEESKAKASLYTKGVLVQTVGILEDDFDIEAMQDTGRKHSKNFEKYVDRIKCLYPDILPMGAGACGICEECSYPDSSCRFPGRAVSSMEAYGLWVSDVCEKSGAPYYHGKLTISYTSCCLLK
jgi:predicted metal-binding protein